ncbi:MAG: hypothetical protein ACLTW9_05910 [Enterocloster sp.]
MDAECSRSKGEILFRDIFFRKHRYTLDDICSVRWNHDGFVFSGSTGKLFKIYDYCPDCKRLFELLEERGAQVDPSGANVQPGADCGGSSGS